MAKPKFRAMSIMAHQDDFEFRAGGTFALLRKVYGDAVALKVICTTRGATGHHRMTPDEIFVRRDAEARRSAGLVGAEYECLTQLDGSHVPWNVFIDRNLLGGLWNAIRAWEPDVVFCPPVVDDPLAGVHIDHLHTAQAVRLVAYQIGVPHAYPTMAGAVKARVRRPLIIVVNDTYGQTAGMQIRQDVSEVVETKLRMSLCHESQVLEWLPFDRNGAPPSRAQFRKSELMRYAAMNRTLGFDDDIPSEFFSVTRWSRPPRPGELKRVFPRMMGEPKGLA